MSVQHDYKKSSQEQRIRDVCVAAEYALESPRENPTTGRRLVQKLDFRFASTIILLYIMNYIVRNSISTGRLKGLEHDLGLSDTQYDTAVASLFILYISTQVPFNMILNRVSRHEEARSSRALIVYWSCAIPWGVICALIGIVNNYGGILICRILLGLPKTAFFPGAIYLLSRWYTRKELALRTSFALAGVMCSNGFGSLISAGIPIWKENVESEAGDGTCMYNKVTCEFVHKLIGSEAYSLLRYPYDIFCYLLATTVDPPNRVPSPLSLESCLYAGEADEDLTEDSMWSGLKMANEGVKVFVFSLILLGDYLGLAFTNFFPYKTGERFFHAFNMIWSTVVGLIIALSTLFIGGRYFSLPISSRTWKTWMHLLLGIRSFIWKTSWAPGYRQSMVISIAALTLSSILAFLMRCKLKRSHKSLTKTKRMLSRMKGFRYLY
ncbi:hypothetical protein ACEPAF_5595 [Sanghuangporus sanghuang]